MKGRDTLLHRRNTVARFGMLRNVLYAFQMRPDGKKAVISSLAGRRVDSVEVLGWGAVSFEHTPRGLTVDVPEGAWTDRPICFRINLI